MYNDLNDIKHLELYKIIKSALQQFFPSQGHFLYISNFPNSRNLQQSLDFPSILAIFPYAPDYHRTHRKDQIHE